LLTWAAVSAAAQDPAVASFRLAGLEVSVVGDAGPFDVSVTTRTAGQALEIATLRLESVAASTPPPLSLRWSLPSHDVYGLWTSGSGFDKDLGPDWHMTTVTSMLARNAPVLTIYGADDQNRLTFAVSDALNSVTLGTGLREENGRVHARIDLFQERYRAVSAVEIEVRFDRRPVPYYLALGDVAAWWADQPGYEPASVPATALLPMYSSWYSYHQSLDVEALLGEVEIARGLGYEAIIIDDGWQTLDSQRGYAFTGDWEPERIPDMKGFVDAVHDRGMKLLLWYSVPLVGERSKVHERFRGKYLRYWDGQGAYELDPRYPEVREHIIETYRNAIRDWGVDGFKLDFLGRFVANDATVLDLGDGRDFASVNEATDRLMTDIMGELQEVNPDVMVEFRQPYIGPLMRKYGNMFRAGDAPNGAVLNRVRTLDLRLLSGSTAVHSDMLMWHYEEPVEDAARQMLNILFSVPQMSVRLAGVPEEHLAMIRYYTAYWNRNRDVLLHGFLEPVSPLSNYPMVRASAEGKQIIALYEPMIATPSTAAPLDRLDVINATHTPRVVLAAPSDLGAYRYVVTDVMGRVTSEGTTNLVAGAHAFDVPVSGMIALERSSGG
jgi:alpha-galactosidase